MGSWISVQEWARTEMPNRKAQIAAVVENYARRLRAGETVQTAEWIADHSDLLPELRNELQAVERIVLARAEAEEIASTLSSAQIEEVHEILFGVRGSTAAEKKSQVTAERGHHLKLLAAIERLRANGDTATAFRERFDPSACSDGTGFAAAQSIGSIRLIREIGRGGMGVVYQGRDELLERVVAVKFLLKAVATATDPDFKRFLEGARAASAVRHESLTTIFQADLSEGIPFLVMEYVDGAPLDRIVKQSGPLPTHLVLHVLRFICAGVSELHEAGIIHRDIKPANVLVERGGRVVVTDFGLSLRTQLLAADSRSVELGGTLPYMAPETFEGAATARTDVYALGVMTYELLTGALPFAGETRELFEQHCSRELPIDALRERGIGDAVIEVLERATHKKPMFRYKSSRQFFQAFENAIVQSQSKRPLTAELSELVARACADDPTEYRGMDADGASSSYY